MPKSTSPTPKLSDYLGNFMAQEAAPPPGPTAPVPADAALLQQLIRQMEAMAQSQATFQASVTAFMAYVRNRLEEVSSTVPAANVDPAPVDDSFDYESFMARMQAGFREQDAREMQQCMEEVQRRKQQRHVYPAPAAAPSPSHMAHRKAPVQVEASASARRMEQPSGTTSNEQPAPAPAAAAPAASQAFVMPRSALSMGFDTTLLGSPLVSPLTRLQLLLPGIKGCCAIHLPDPAARPNPLATSTRT